MEKFGGKYASLTEEEVKDLRKMAYSDNYEGRAPIKLAGKVAYVE